MEPAPTKKIKIILKRILFVYEWVLSFINKAIEKRLEERKREFFLEHKVEMTESEIKLTRNKLVLSLLFIVTFIIFIIYQAIK